MTGQTVAIIVGEVVAIITVGLALLGSIWRMFAVFRNDMNKRFDRVDAESPSPGNRPLDITRPP